ncbi:4'-phosphopantetheinyl transferase family protein [Croceivirga thetidis]|uniref:4'-phosphopantetheinyl transferase superfamily protein n=1 Tax=Croceivirga thetidis TaxID=2721623 RepID=A0ABX1GTD0_9FLAO|nr:4'-phosphopantetheinyl transferase superfamily protein [Croceivirga thetidis]NKI31977.1 4'-phosphopantetheinyl transferase superfamily protein [Croceivirga thetidis]
MMIVLYTFLDQEFQNPLTQKLSSNFPKEFVNRINRYKRWQDSQASIIGRLLLAKGCELLKIDFKQHQVTLDKYEKPFLESNELNFNISHSSSIVVCAISKTIELGIDVELIKEIEIADFHGQMTSNEWETVHNSENPKQAFFDYWTEKEAVLKAHGKGLNTPLKSFEIRNGKTILEGKSFYLSKIPLHSEYSCHLATTSKLAGTTEVQAVAMNKLITA